MNLIPDRIFYWNALNGIAQEDVPRSVENIAAVHIKTNTQLRIRAHTKNGTTERDDHTANNLTKIVSEMTVCARVLYALAAVDCDSR